MLLCMDNLFDRLCPRWPTDITKYNMYVGHWNLTTDILHNLRNAKRIRFSLYFLSQNITPFKRGKSKNIWFIFNRILTWHCGVITLHPAWPFAHAHYRNRIEFGRLYGSKKRLRALKRVRLLCERNAFGCIAFEHCVGQ